MHNTQGENIDLKDCSQNKDKKDSVVFREISDSTQIGAESFKNTIVINEVSFGKNIFKYGIYRKVLILFKPVLILLMTKI